MHNARRQKGESIASETAQGMAKVENGGGEIKGKYWQCLFVLNLSKHKTASKKV